MRKLTRLAAAVVMLAGVVFACWMLFPFSTAGPPQASAGQSEDAIQGDADCSGVVDPIDGLRILRQDAGLGEVPCPDAADVNCDGAVNPLDSLLILRFDAGLPITPVDDCTPIGDPIAPLLIVTEIPYNPDWRDYGDAPDGTPTGYSTGAQTGNFPTQPQNGGPFHPLPFTVWLGEGMGVEPEPYDRTDADDGLHVLDVAPCGASSALISINPGNMTGEQLAEPVFVNILADWNRDGDWNDDSGCAPEWALQNRQVDLAELGGGLAFVGLEFTGGDQVDEFWMRVTVTRTQYDPAIGGQLDGETEDYLVTGGAAGFAISGQGGGAPPARLDNQFFCRGTVVQHSIGGIGQVSIGGFRIQQTQDSFDRGFRPQGQGRLGVGGPVSPSGWPAVGVTFSSITAVPVPPVPGQPAPAAIDLAMEIRSSFDPPERLQGPIRFTVQFEADSNRGPFRAQITCAFYIDHIGDVFYRRGGFTGGPGRSGRSPTDSQPEFIVVDHGERIFLKNDFELPFDPAHTDEKYEDGSLTLFDGLGDKIPTTPDSLKSRGLKDLTTPVNGRSIWIDTIHDPPKRSESFIVRLKVVRTGANYYDYYRVIVNHNDDETTKQLIQRYKDTGFALRSYGEDEPFKVAYASDGTSVRRRTAALEGFVFDDEETICQVGAGVGVAAEPAGTFGSPLLGVGGIMRSELPGSTLSPLQDVGFIGFYNNQGSSDFFIPPVSDNGIPTCGEGGFAVTRFGATAQVSLQRGNQCDSRFVFGESVNSQYRVISVNYGSPQPGQPPPGFPFPVPGSDGLRYPNCFPVNMSGFRVVGSLPGAGGRSNIAYVDINGVPGPLASVQSAGPTVLLEAPNPREHLLFATVSPDGSLIAFEYQVIDESVSIADAQVYVGDFDPLAPSISNIRKLTSQPGFNGRPTWSPDSQQIAFMSTRDGNLEIYVMDADGSNQVNMTNTPDTQEFDPSWMVP